MLINPTKVSQDGGSPVAKAACRNFQRNRQEALQEFRRSIARLSILRFEDWKLPIRHGLKDHSADSTALLFDERA